MICSRGLRFSSFISDLLDQFFHVIKDQSAQRFLVAEIAQHCPVNRAASDEIVVRRCSTHPKAMYPVLALPTRDGVVRVAIVNSVFAHSLQTVEPLAGGVGCGDRSEEHTSELQ